MLETAVTFSHTLLKKSISPGDTVVDATVGNGNDTILLASLVGKTGKVIGFDIQSDAINKTKEQLLFSGLLPQVSLHETSHEYVADFIPINHELGGAIFNLGYLPGGNKEITTLKESTIKSIASMLDYLRVGSLVVIVVYSGHDIGAEEDALLNYVQKLNQKQFSVLHYQFLNQKNNPPSVIAIERLRKE